MTPAGRRPGGQDQPPERVGRWTPFFPAAAVATCRTWRRASVEDLPMGPHRLRSSARSDLEEAAVLEFRIQTRLPLNDVSLALRSAIPWLTRHTRDSCLTRQDVSRLRQRRRGRTSRLRPGEPPLQARPGAHRRPGRLARSGGLWQSARSGRAPSDPHGTDGQRESFSDVGGRRLRPRSHPFDSMGRLLDIEHRPTNL